jgi:hypothetical protein
VLATLSTTRSDNLIADGVANDSALTSGYHLAFWIGAALVVASIAIALAVIEPVKMPAEGMAPEDEEVGRMEPASETA